MKQEKHIHKYDNNGKRICCSLEEKIDLKPPPPIVHTNDDGHDHDHDHDHNHDDDDDDEGDDDLRSKVATLSPLGG